jgi:hypothetical protein
VSVQAWCWRSQSIIKFILDSRLLLCVLWTVPRMQNPAIVYCQFSPCLLWRTSAFIYLLIGSRILKGFFICNAVWDWQTFHHYFVVHSNKIHSRPIGWGFELKLCNDLYVYVYWYLSGFYISLIRNVSIVPDLTSFLNTALRKTECQVWDNQ